jgi:hypothetical protein
MMAIIDNGFLVGLMSSVVAAFSVYVVSRIYHNFIDIRRQRKSLSAFGKWYMYRRVGPKGRIIKLDINIKESVWKGLYCEFFSRHIVNGRYTGKVSITNNTISCVFNDSRLDGPFLLNFCNIPHGEGSKFMLGTASGTLKAPVTIYCSQIVASKEKLNDKQAGYFLGELGTIQISQADSLKKILTYMHGHNSAKD